MKALALAALLGLMATAAFAQTNTTNIDAREANQQQRIQQGVASGQLNAREANRLERKEGTIARAEDHAKTDGKVTKAKAPACNTAKIA